MNYHPLSIFLPSLACVLTLGCDRADHSVVQPSDQRSTAARSATVPSESPLIYYHQISPKPAQALIENHVAKTNFDKIRQFREAKKDVKHANAEFKRLCELWDPVGRSVSEVKEVVGKPDWEEENSFGYKFDTGANVWEWTFFNNKGEVIKIQCDGY